MPYSIQQQSNTSCGAYALAAYLEESGIPVREALIGIGDVPGSSELEEWRIGRKLYERVQDSRLAGYCAPMKMAGVINRHFGAALGMHRVYRVDDSPVDRRLRDEQNVMEVEREALVGAVQRMGVPPTRPLLCLVIDWTAATSWSFRNLHWVCRRVDGTYYDPGKHNRENNVWGDPTHPLLGTSAPPLGSTKYGWAGVYIAPAGV